MSSNALEERLLALQQALGVGSLLEGSTIRLFK
jgi:hypothetical protein